MKIVLFDTEDWERETFADLERDHEVVAIDQPLTAETVDQAKDADVISAFIYSKLTGDLLEQCPNLKLIATRSTGVDHVDVDWCADHDVQVANVPTYGENTVAEHTFALILAIAHKLPQATERTRKGDFSKDGLRGFDLEGRTLGVVGTGNIGLHTCRIAKGFGMEVLGFDVKPQEDKARDIGFAYTDLDDLLGRADIVSIHVPGSAKTKDMIDADAFAKMKDGVVLINTARGGVVNVEALSQALLEGKVGAAGLDVLPEEPVIREEAETLRSVFTQGHDLTKLLADHALLRLDNVVITPHNAFNTTEAVQRILDTTHDNITSFIDGQPRNIVNGKAA